MWIKLTVYFYYRKLFPRLSDNSLYLFVACRRDVAGRRASVSARHRILRRRLAVLGIYVSYVSTIITPGVFSVTLNAVLLLEVG